MNEKPDWDDEKLNIIEKIVLTSVIITFAVGMIKILILLI